MMNILQGVIFDLDGVLCYTDNYHYLAWKALADKLSIVLPSDFKDKVRGISRMDSLEILLGNKSSKFSETEKINLANEKNDIYKSLLESMTEDDIAPNALDLLLFLKGNNCRIAVGSSSRNAPFILEKLGISDLFDAICDGSMITKSKPDPEVFLKAATMLNLKPAKCLVVEDAYMGIEAATSGGFLSAAIGPDAKRNQKATFKVNDLAELKGILTAL